MMKLILLITLFIAVFSLLMNILMWIRINKVLNKHIELKRFVEDRVIPNANRAFAKQNDRFNTIEYKINSLSSYTPQQTVQSKIVTQSVQQPNQQPVQSPIQQSQQSRKSKHNKHNKRDNEINKQQQPIIVKTIFLGINSDDFFFDNEVDIQNSATSKFIGQLTSDSEGTFVPIDVERIRSANVAASVKQQGLISLKDAQSFNVIEPGKIHKEDQGWVIESPVIVEFVK